MSQQTADGPPITITGPRVGIQIPQQHEGGGRIQPPLATGIILQVIRAIEIVAPQPDLVMIATAVTPLGTVKDWRHRMTQQQMQALITPCGWDLHRQIQVVLRGEAQLG